MKLNEIQEQIAISLHKDCHHQWFEVLDDSTPGHYGVDDLEFEVNPADIWVNIPKRTFTFKNATLSGCARLGASSEKYGIDHNFKIAVSGVGKFDFKNSQSVEARDFNINEPIDFFEN